MYIISTYLIVVWNKITPNWLFSLRKFSMARAWNELIEFPLFLMGKFVSSYECFDIRATSRNELNSEVEVPLHLVFLIMKGPH